MDGYLKIKTKIDNKEVDKGITELENKIKKAQTENKDLSNEEGLLQQEINNYDELRQKANEYKKKIQELKNEKAKIKSIPSSNLIMNNQEYKDITDKIQTIKKEYLNMLQEIEKKKIDKDKKQNLVQQTNDNYLPKIDTLNNKKRQIVANVVPNTTNINQQIEGMKQKYKETTTEIEKQGPKIDKVAVKLDKVKQKQQENNNKISQFKQKIEQIKLNRVQKEIDNVGKGIQGSISKLGKMSMAIFGIRTAISAVRQAISMVAQYNPQIAADLEYMRYCIANLLAPAIQGLVKLLYTVLSYINAIASAWFGINLFGNSSVKNFQKMQNSASGTAKSAKEIQKSLQGFDEMNVLQDNSNSGASGGSGAVAPSIDLSGMQAEIPGWLQWIIDNKDLILSIIARNNIRNISIEIGT